MLIVFNYISTHIVAPEKASVGSQTSEGPASGHQTIDQNVSRLSSGMSSIDSGG
jgi:hypothetical protein